MDGDNKLKSAKYLRCAYVDDIENTLLFWDVGKFL